MGEVASNNSTGNLKSKSVNHITIENPKFDLEKFFEAEDIPPGPNPKNYTQEEIECEQHYIENTTRHEDGRYIVRIPFKKNHPELGNSKTTAKNRLNGLKYRFIKILKSRNLIMNLFKNP